MRAACHCDQHGVQPLLYPPAEAASGRPQAQTLSPGKVSHRAHHSPPHAASQQLVFNENYIQLFRQRNCLKFPEQQWLLWEIPSSCHSPPIHWKAPSAGFVSLQTRLDVYTSHYPDGTSVKNIIHWAQVGPLTHTHPWDGPFTESQGRHESSGVPDNGKVKARNQKRCWVQDELPWSLWGPGDTAVCVLCWARQDKGQHGEATDGCWIPQESPEQNLGTP